ncbi:MAG: universal stress protein [Candidatus Krumholzibacteria bacterium]|jgi:nucleotide-binding universal stress UspA family protein|nr:universal stress protein [Candidatus Krumholzibacteria bacterium]
MHIKTILCPTDFSEPAERALKAARGFALRFEARIVLLHVSEPLPLLASPHVGGAVTNFDVPGYQEARLEQAREHLEALAKKHASPDLKLETRLREGVPADMINDTAAEEEADMIVIATSGRSAFRRFLFGSVAEKVIRSAPCPVLTIASSDE